MAIAMLITFASCTQDEAQPIPVLEDSIEMRGGDNYRNGHFLASVLEYSTDSVQWWKVDEIIVGNGFNVSHYYDDYYFVLDGNLVTPGSTSEVSEMIQQAVLDHTNKCYDITAHLHGYHISDIIEVDNQGDTIQLYPNDTTEVFAVEGWFSINFEQDLNVPIQVKTKAYVQGTSIYADTSYNIPLFINTFATEPLNIDPHIYNVHDITCKTFLKGDGDGEGGPTLPFERWFGQK